MDVSLSLNDRLAQASKKFTKACEQIKVLKQRIAELIGMFTYCDQNQNNNESNLSTSPNLNFNKNLFRESVRQQIENLQSIKTAYFMYAHKKADEITKLQCELYGEDAVREAYETAPPSALIAASPESSNNSSNDQEESSSQDQDTNSADEDDYEDPSDWGALQDDQSDELYPTNSANNSAIVLPEFDYLTA